MTDWTEKPLKIAQTGKNIQSQDNERFLDTLIKILRYD